MNATAKLVAALRRYIDRDHAAINMNPRANHQLPDRACICGACDEARAALDAYTAEHIGEAMDKAIDDAERTGR